MFSKSEKVFSLARTAEAVPFNDLSSLFSEFYCYLLVAGLFREGEGRDGVHIKVLPIADENFELPSGSYRSGLARLIGQGLKKRFDVLVRHPDLSEREIAILTKLNHIFTDDRGFYITLSGKDLYSVAFSRDFTADMVIVARYVAVAFGQLDFPPSAEVSRLYLSVFGNIHLAKPRAEQESGYCDALLTVDTPALRYGAKDNNLETVTALWSIMSSITDSLSDAPYPGNALGDMLSSMSFLTEPCQFEKSIPVPTFASSLYIQRLMGVDGYNPVAASAAFYKAFLYGSTETLAVSRGSLLQVVLNLMMEKMGEARLSHLFTPSSFYTKLASTRSLTGKTYARPAVLRMALEALAPELLSEDDAEDSEMPDVEPTADPQTDVGGFDPSTPAPVTPVGVTVEDTNTIGLISFDKSGEGVNEDLYRQAVVALNDRLRSDDTLSIKAEVKESLNHWVNGYLYRTAISATKDQISFLKLQNHLKPVSIKG